MNRYVSDPMDLPEVDEDGRVDLVFYGVDHSGPSYEARVFLNNPDATLDTPRNAESGYAGSFNVFGHGACYGEAGHCDPQTELHDDFDLRPPHPLEPLTKIVIVTNALRNIEGDTVTVTVVAAEHSGEQAAESDALAFEHLRMAAYEG